MNAENPRELRELPAWFAGLSGVAAVVVPAAASAAATKALSTVPGPFGLRLGLVDLQGPSAELSSVQRRDGLVGFAGVRHFHKCEAARATGFAVSDEVDLFHRSVFLEDVAQFGFGGAVG